MRLHACVLNNVRLARYGRARASQTQNFVLATYSGTQYTGMRFVRRFGQVSLLVKSLETTTPLDATKLLID